MDKRLIDANTLHAKIMKDNDNDLSRKENIAQFLLRIETAPTIEAKPIQHGLWLNMTKGIPLTEKQMNSGSFSWCCSVCREYSGTQYATRRFNFCPYCGAKIDADHIADDSKKVGGTENDD